jgi:uncharacterized protein (DUF342 family)
MLRAAMSTTTPRSSNSKLNESGLVLPAYVLLRPNGVFINLSPPPPQDILQMFVDRLFGSEARFAGLDYAHFQDLLYGDDPAKLQQGGKTELKIADSIVRFLPQRVELYREPKIDISGNLAEYMFEPVFMDVVKEAPVYGEPDADGVRPVLEYRSSVENQPAQLDFDEFVAAMWLKGVRFGIDADAVREAIEKGKFTRLIFASQREPTESVDARIVEESDHLRQDNAPMILSDGRADLRRAKNRFPQVARNTPLLRKIPRELGKSGYRVTGATIEARIPLDIDFNKLSGEGTRIERSPGGELLVSSMDGFLILDEHTSEISITEKIENKSGISAKSTGDILLAVDHYVEHGEVQEGRIVEGKHMSFRSNVFGTVIAKDGDIEIGGNLSGGRAQCEGGDVSIKGRAINATLVAWDGKITAEFAEGSLIIGKNVTIAHAVNCEIVAEEVQLVKAEGCSIGSKNIRIGTATARKHQETVIAILLPDIAAIDRQISEARTSLAQIEQAIQAKNREMLATQSDPAFARYLAIADKVRAGTIQFTPEQQVGWQKAVNQFAPIVKGSENLMRKNLALGEAIARWTEERKTCGENLHCVIGTVSGETVVRKLASNLGMTFFRNLTEQQIRTELRQLGEARERIFSADHGAFEWTFKVPEPPAVA